MVSSLNERDRFAPGRGDALLALLATLSCLLIVACSMTVRRFAFAVSAYAARPRASVALGAMLLAGLIALFCVGLIPHLALYAGFWIIMAAASALAGGPPLRSALAANTGALCFMLAANLLHFGFLCFANSRSSDTPLMRLLLVAGALALASLYLIVLARIFKGAYPQSERADQALHPFLVFTCFASFYALLDLAPSQNDMAFVFLPYTLLGSTLLVTVACGTFAFVATRLGAEALRESENRALERKRKDQETRLRLYLARASVDELTGLATRRAGQEELDRIEMSQEPYTLGFIDLDGLKKINDEQGHLRGDRYLVACADELTAAFPESIVVRWGGDEFLIIDKTLGGTQMEERLARLEWEGTSKEPPIKFSYGVAAGAPDAAETLESADAAMYRAKRNKKAAAQQTEEGGAQ